MIEMINEFSQMVLSKIKNKTRLSKDMRVLNVLNTVAVTEAS